MRIGLAGVGRIGAFHAATLHGLPDVALVVADADRTRAEVVAAGLSRTGEAVEVVDSLDRLIARGLDGVVIATPTDTHPQLILAAVDAGVPVFCEKPVAADVAATRAVLGKVSHGGVPVHIGFQRRFDAGYAAAREAVVTGALGRLHTIRACTFDPAPPPAEYIARSGGLFKDCSVHDFDAVRWVTGREVVEAYATGSDRGAAFFRAAGDVDTAVALLRLEGDALAVVSAGRYNGAGYDVRMEVHGVSATVAVGLDDRMPVRSAEDRVSFPAGAPWPSFMERFQPAYVAELRAFLDVAAGRRQTPCGVGDALAAFVVAEACELSRRERRPVRVAEVAG
jgi:myo-inositol 2-dehydrogenase / D-chiro-inositol 1-dehydrogenase